MDDIKKYLKDKGHLLSGQVIDIAGLNVLNIESPQDRDSQKFLNTLSATWGAIGKQSKGYFINGSYEPHKILFEMALPIAQQQLRSLVHNAKRFKWYEDSEKGEFSIPVRELREDERKVLRRLSSIGIEELEGSFRLGEKIRHFSGEWLQNPFYSELATAMEENTSKAREELISRFLDMFTVQLSAKVLHNRRIWGADPILPLYVIIPRTRSSRLTDRHRSLLAEAIAKDLICLEPGTEKISMAFSSATASCRLWAIYGSWQPS